MYMAVFRFGPKWDFDADACFCKGCPACANPIIKRVSRYRPEYKDADFEELRSRLASGRFSIQQIEELAEYQLNTDILRGGKP